jgi:chorismate mutase
LLKMQVRGIRGATTVDENSAEAISQATIELLEKIVQTNSVDCDDIASAFFSTSPDLNAEFPAVAARRLGWTNIALFCSQEIGVPGSLPKCIRVLLHVNTNKRANEIVHIYMRGARVLRPDLAPLQ